MHKFIYKTPKVALLSSTSTILSEVAARTCYNSFNKSKHTKISEQSWRQHDLDAKHNLSSLNPEFQSELSEELAHVHHHGSIIEHVSCTYELQDVGRGVLQELARHRIGVSLSVQSTRYTLNNIIAAYIASDGSLIAFSELSKKYLSDILVVEVGSVLWDAEMYKIVRMLDVYSKQIGYYDKFLPDVLSKEAIEYLKEYNTLFSYENIYTGLISCKQKRNAGDTIKFIVSDLWATNIVITFNARSLAHFMKLRDSGAAWFPIRELAIQIYNTTPPSIQRLIRKPKKVKEK